MKKLPILAIALFLFQVYLAETTCIVEDLFFQAEAEGLTSVLLNETCISSQNFTFGYSITIEGGNAGLWDNDFFKANYHIASGNVTLSLQNLIIDNVLLYTNASNFLELEAFVPTLRPLVLENVFIQTTCFILSELKATAERLFSVSQSDVGNTYLVVQSYSSARVLAQNVTIICPEPIYADSLPDQLLAVDSLSLVNALYHAQQGYSNTTSIFMGANISLAWVPFWPQPTLNVTVPISISGSPTVQTVWDLYGLVFYMAITSSGNLTLSELTLMNLWLPEGEGIYGTDLAVFTYVLWFFEFPRTEIKMMTTNTVIVLLNLEFNYLNLWAFYATAQIPVISEQTGELREFYSVIQVQKCQASTNLCFKDIVGVGVSSVNETFTTKVPSAFPVVVPAAIPPDFSYTLYTGITQIPVYDASDFWKCMTDLAAAPSDIPTAMLLWHNVTLADLKWPSEGVTITSPLFLASKTTSWVTLDLDLVARFLNTSTTYLTIYGLRISNVASLTSPETVGGSASTYSSPLWPFVVPRTYTVGSSAIPRALFNFSVLVIPYQEFMALLQNLNIKYGGVDALDPEQDAVWDTNINLVVNAVSKDSINVSGSWFGWQMWYSNITYLNPNYPVLYNNVYSPVTYLSPNPPSPPKGSSSSSNSLVNWQIALIAVGCALVAVLVFTLGGVLFIQRFKQELVKAAVTTESDQAIEANGAKADSPQNNSRQAGVSDSSSAKQRVDIMETSTADGVRSLQGATLPTDELHTLIGALFREINDKHLTILDVLGQGGFGTVYKGMWKGLLVAVKTIVFQDQLVSGDKKAQHRAILEAAISTSLSHPNVVITYSYDLKPLLVSGRADSGMIISHSTVTDWKLYIIQEYCDAGSLRQAIVKKKLLDSKTQNPLIEHILEMALEMANGLDHLHSKNIIHGDLNPNNVLLKRDASTVLGVTIKICDFGLSVKMNEGQSHISNMRRGTPFYTAPEVSSKGNMTKAADVYSYGVILWELYHQTTCYKDTRNGFMQDKAFPTFPGSCPYEFAELAESCQSQDPLERPTFKEIGQHLSGMIHRLKWGMSLRTKDEEEGQLSSEACNVITVEGGTDGIKLVGGPGDGERKTESILKKGIRTRRRETEKMKDLDGGNDTGTDDNSHNTLGNGGDEKGVEGAGDVLKVAPCEVPDDNSHNALEPLRLSTVVRGMQTAAVAKGGTAPGRGEKGVLEQRKDVPADARVEIPPFAPASDGARGSLIIMVNGSGCGNEAQAEVCVGDEQV